MHANWAGHWLVLQLQTGSAMLIVLHGRMNSSNYTVAHRK